MGTEQGENWGFEATEDAFDKPKLWMKRKKSGYLKYIKSYNQSRFRSKYNLVPLLTFEVECGSWNKSYFSPLISLYV